MHAFVRRTTADLVQANERYQAGDGSALTIIVERLRAHCDFCPRHIEKEDKVFLPAARPTSARRKTRPCWHASGNSTGR
jgi:hemerythrin-like domain-containing protein